MNHSEDIEPGFQGMKKELPFKVPRHYFEDFPARMQSRLEQELQAEVRKPLRFFDYLKPVIGLAAAFVLVFMLVYWPARIITHPAKLSSNGTNGETERFIKLIEPIDDHTFFSLLEQEPDTESPGEAELETFIAANYSDYDIYLETQK